MSGISRNSPCWCGSGKKFKKCHYPENAPYDDLAFTHKTSNQAVPSFEQFLQIMGMPKPVVSNEAMANRLKQIIYEKELGNRIKPSFNFIDKSELLSAEKRKSIIDISAKYVDENWCGRSEMCQQFAMLVKNILKKEGINSKIIEGDAEYFAENLKHNWNHFWLITENEELIDCNIDSLPENPYCPDGLKPKNYWGAIKSIPPDRKYTDKKEFTEDEEIFLEKQDQESLIWKNKSIQEYEEIWK